MAAFPAVAGEIQHLEALELTCGTQVPKPQHCIWSRGCIEDTLCAVLSESPAEGGSRGHSAAKGFLLSLVELSVLSPYSWRPESVFPGHSAIFTVYPSHLYSAK